MGTVNVADVAAVGFIALIVVGVLILLPFAYMRGFAAGNRSHNCKTADAQDAFRNGYNLGYMHGDATERKRQWKS